MNKSYRDLRQEMEQLQAVLDAVPGYVSWFSIDGRYLGVNKVLADSFGKPLTYFVGKELGFERSEHDFTRFVREFLTGSRDHEAREIEIPDIRANRVFYIVAQKYSLRQAAVFVGIDITELKNAQDKIFSLSQFQQMLIENADVMICFFDREARISIWNKASEKITGFGREEVVGRGDLFDLLFTDHKIRNRIVRAKEDLKEGHQTALVIEAAIATKSGESKMLSLSMKSLTNLRGDIVGLITIASDITALKNSERILQESKERFRYLSFHDSVTGLYNRAYLEAEIDRLGKDIMRSHPLTLIAMKILNLKELNETYGYSMGDAVIKSAAGLFSRSFRMVDIVARLSTASFCAILPHVNANTAVGLQRRILDHIEKIASERSSLPIYFAIGCATSQGVPSESVYDILKCAQENMISIRKRESSA
ncbi:diguanylate cyclase [bacterium]|nr:diguanylate cyclase [candidate division CSSED10-310 bacterium]